MLPPLLALREHRTASVEVHVPHGDPVEIWIELETGGRRGPLRQLENWTPPQEIDGGWVGEATFEIPGDLPLGYHTLHARSQRADGDDAADHHPGVARAARTGWGSAGPGGWPPSSTASARASPGASATSPTWRTWPSGRPARTAPTSSWSTRCTPPSRGRRWSPRPTCRPAAASPTRSTCGWSGSPSTPLLDDKQRGKVNKHRVELKVRLARATAIDRNRSWEAKRKALKIIFSVPRTPGREASLRRRTASREGEG